jgi:AcrR family transcriptional regulator
MVEPPAPRADARERIIEAAAALLREEGPAAVTTRRVAERAGAQAPTIYRLFGDKDGLLDAVAEHVMANFATAKASLVDTAEQNDVDPLQDLRDGWDAQLAFGLANPSLITLLSAPGRVANSPAARSGRRVLERRVHRLAAAGRLRVPEQRAVDLIQAAGIGSIQLLLSTPEDRRDLGVAAAMHEAVLAQILVDAAPPAADAVEVAAIALRAAAPDLSTLTDGERALLVEWLDRGIREGGR